AAMVFTIRYYHFIVPLETAMSLGGIGLIIFAWALTRYLQIPRSGFTSEELRMENSIEKMHLESLILAETFARQSIDAGDTKFGGGGFGGGGASGEF
ncbi:MAG: hypothetical protein ABJA37_11050, partial [Ferruginibacter sp.]